MRFFVVGLASVILLAPQLAHAWDHDGHEVVAIIAERHLTPEAHAKVRELLLADGAANMAEVAGWADDYRNQHRETGPWHYVNIELADDRYDRARDCPNGDCVVEKISEFARTLADPSASQSDRITALKFVIHLVGDIHQPLHCTDNHDKGGNDLQVTFAGKQTNLHHLWDVEYVNVVGGNDPAKLANELNHAFRLPSLVDEMSEGKPTDWANESHAEGAKLAYGILPKNPKEDLVKVYAQFTASLVRFNLAEAGFRLAKVLNEALK